MIRRRSQETFQWERITLNCVSTADGAAGAFLVLSLVGAACAGGNYEIKLSLGKFRSAYVFGGKKSTFATPSREWCTRFSAPVALPPLVPPSRPFFATLLYELTSISAQWKLFNCIKINTKIYLFIVVPLPLCLVAVTALSFFIIRTASELSMLDSVSFFARRYFFTYFHSPNHPKLKFVNFSNCLPVTLPAALPLIEFAMLFELCRTSRKMKSNLRDRNQINSFIAFHSSSARAKTK